MKSALLASAVLAVTAATVLPTNATTIALGPGSSTLVGAGNHDLAPDSFSPGTVAYLQDWFFNINTATTLSANASVSNSSGELVPLQLSLFSDGGAHGVKDGGDALLTGAFVSSAAGITAFLTNILLTSPGFYYVQVDNGGATTPSGPNAIGGVVTGNISLSPSVVPIPGALPLFATGLAGLIVLGRKRRKAKQGSAA
jgi:hypothetical protein